MLARKLPSDQSSPPIYNNRFALGLHRNELPCSQSYLCLGFSETQLAPDVWRVMYRGYYIPKPQAGDYAMLRAAEVVKSAGYRYFKSKTSAVAQRRWAEPTASCRAAPALHSLRLTATPKAVS